MSYLNNNTNKGKVELLNSDLTTRVEYSADISQQKHEKAGTNKGTHLKIGNNYVSLNFVESLYCNLDFSVSAIKILTKRNFYVTLSLEKVNKEEASPKRKCK